MLSSFIFFRTFYSLIKIISYFILSLNMMTDAKSFSCKFVNKVCHSIISVSFKIFPEPMKDWKSLAHTKWECKYHVALIPKCRHKVLFGKSRKLVGEILREL